MILSRLFFISLYLYNIYSHNIENDLSLLSSLPIRNNNNNNNRIPKSTFFSTNSPNLSPPPSLRHVQINNDDSPNLSPPSLRYLQINNDDIGIPPNPHPAGPPTLSWFTAGTLPTPCWNTNSSSDDNIKNTTDTINNNATTRYSSSDIPIHPLYLLGYSKRIIIPNNTNTDKINNTLYLLGSYKACKGETAAVYPLLNDDCSSASTSSVLQRSYNYGKTWEICDNTTIPSNLIKFGQSTLVFQHPKTINDPNSSHASAVPIIFNTVEEANQQCHLMCVFGGIIKVNTTSIQNSFITPVTAVNSTTATSTQDIFITEDTSSSKNRTTIWNNVNTVYCCRLPDCTTWIEQPSLPWGVSYSTAIQFGDHIYVIGGNQDNGKSSLFQSSVNFSTCTLDSWVVPIDEVPIAPRRIGIMATEMFSTKTLLIGGGTTISSEGEPLYPNPDLWSTETPAILSSWRMLTPNLPLGDVNSNPADDLTSILDFSTIVIDKTNGKSLPLAWIYAAHKAYMILMDSIPPRVNPFPHLLYPNPTNNGGMLVPFIRQPVIMYDPTISAAGHPSVFALPVTTDDQYYNKLIRIDIIRCSDMCSNDYYTNGCVAHPLDAKCYPCDQCEIEGITRAINKCQYRYLNYGNTECSNCSECVFPLVRTAYCNETHDTQCGIRNPYNSLNPLPPLTVDAEINPIFLRLVFILSITCALILIFSSVLYAIFVPMPTTVHINDRLVEITRCIRSLWPFALSIASVITHTCLASGLVSIGSDTPFFKPAIGILFIVIGNILGNIFIAYTIFRSITLYSSTSSSFSFNIDSLFDQNTNKKSLQSYIPTTTVTSPLPIVTTAFRNISRNKLTGVVPPTINVEQTISSSPFANTSSTSTSPTAANSIQEFAFNNSVPGTYDYRTNLFTYFTISSMKIFYITLGMTMFHPRCLLHFYPGHSHNTSLLPSIRYIHAFTIRWITVATFIYDAPLLLLCLTMLGNVYVVRTSSAFILCAFLGFVNIVSTLSWTASITAKIKTSSVLRNSPTNKSTTSIDNTDNNSKSDLEISESTATTTNTTNNTLTNDTRRFSHLIQLDDSSLSGEIIVPPSILRSNILTNNTSNNISDSQITTNNRQIAVALARGTTNSVIVPQSQISDQNESDSIRISHNGYQQQATDAQSVQFSLISSPPHSTTGDIPRAIANMRRQIELYSQDDSISCTNVSIKDDVSESARTYLSSQMI